MRPIKLGATDQSVTVRIVDSGDGTPETGVVAATAGLALWYRRQGGLKVAIGSLTNLATLDAAHADGGLLHVSDGYYRIDVPDAAFASGSTEVTVGGSVTGMVVIAACHPLVAYDPADAAALGLSRLDAAVSSRSTLTAAGVWDQLLSAISTASSIGKLISDNLNATVSSRLASASYTVPPTAVENRQEMDSGSTGLAAIYGRLGAPAGASVSADVAAVKTDTGNLLSRIPAALFSGITSLGNWLRLLARKSGGDATALTELNSGGGTYAANTDSLEGSVDSGGSGLTAAAVWAHTSRTLTQSGSQVATAVAGGKISIMRGDRVSISLTGLGSLAAVTQLWFTVKGTPKTDADAAAIVQVALVGGLLYLNGAAGTAGQGSITVDDADEGDVTIALAAAATAQLEPAERLTYDVQLLGASGPSTPVRGRCDVVEDVTRAVS